MTDLGLNFKNVNSGNDGKGISRDIFGNSDPMVSTGIPKQVTTAVKAPTTTMYEGIRGKNLCKNKIKNNDV